MTDAALASSSKIPFCEEAVSSSGFRRIVLFIIPGRRHKKITNPLFDLFYLIFQGDYIKFPSLAVFVHNTAHGLFTALYVLSRQNDRILGHIVLREYVVFTKLR